MSDTSIHDSYEQMLTEHRRVASEFYRFLGGVEWLAKDGGSYTPQERLDKIAAMVTELDKKLGGAS